MMSFSDQVRKMIERHKEFTGSEVAARVLDDWDGFLRRCVKVMPIDYKRVLAELEKEKQTVGA